MDLYTKQDDKSLYNEKISRWPIFVFLISAAACLLLSTTYHLFNVISFQVNKILLRLDYTGVNLLISGSTFPVFYYGFYCQFHLAIIYITTIGVACLTVFFISLKDFIHTAQYFILKSVMYGSLGIFAAVPIIHLAINEVLFDNFGDPYRTSGSLVYYLLMGACYLGGLTIYALRFPERTRPGKFDYCGASH